jgi:hypothetical protein
MAISPATKGKPLKAGERGYSVLSPAQAGAPPATPAPPAAAAEPLLPLLWKSTKKSHCFRLNQLGRSPPGKGGGLTLIHLGGGHCLSLFKFQVLTTGDFHRQSREGPVSAVHFRRLLATQKISVNVTETSPSNPFIVTNLGLTLFRLAVIVKQ